MKSHRYRLALLVLLLLSGCAQASKESGKSQIRPEQVSAEFATQPTKIAAGTKAELSIRLKGPITFNDTEVYIEVKKLVENGSGERIDFSATSDQPDLFTAKHAFAEPGTYTAMIHIYAPEVHKMQDANFYVGEKETAQTSGEDAKPASTAARVALEAPILLGTAAADIDGDGQQEAIRFTMVSGAEVTDPNPGPYEGTFYTGHCELTVARGDKVLFRLGLEEEQSFRKRNAPFALQVADYNGDGQSDFSLGQWAGSNGSFYDLYTIRHDGIQLLESGIYSAGHWDSLLYPMEGQNGFANIYYSNGDTTGYFKVIRTWNGSAFDKGELLPATDQEVKAFASVQ
ncbi:hypothetical protein [Gorillibacterium timonense]|uniref:hypothetical protein n=1 Tax=Gorillibacterium timonense TaxID=1689269 RepID=UPI00071DFACE|nr:hypothetical protein [Gorillibacterium timonense]